MHEKEVDDHVEQEEKADQELQVIDAEEMENEIQ